MSETITAAVIPAYQEAERVGPVVNAALLASRVDLVVVVDDGSDDDTFEVAKTSGGAEHPGTKLCVVRHEVNMGKFEAMQTGVEMARKLGGSSLRTLVFIDADLSPIESRDGENAYIWRSLLKGSTTSETPQTVDNFIERLATYIDDLVSQVEEYERVMSIGLPSRNKIVDRMRHLLDWGALGGNRAMPITLWDAVTETYGGIERGLKGWEVEAAQNTYTRRHRDQNGNKLNRGIKKVPMPDVVNVGSRLKAGGIIPGLIRMTKIHGAAIRAFARFSLQRPE